MRDLDDVFGPMERSAFRKRFKLGAKEQAYLNDRGPETILSHGRDFIAKRPAPARPPMKARAEIRDKQ